MRSIPAIPRRSLRTPPSPGPHRISEDHDRRWRARGDVRLFVPLNSGDGYSHLRGVPESCSRDPLLGTFRVPNEDGARPPVYGGLVILFMKVRLQWPPASPAGPSAGQVSHVGRPISFNVISTVFHLYEDKRPHQVRWAVAGFGLKYFTRPAGNSVSSLRWFQIRRSTLLANKF